MDIAAAGKGCRKVWDRRNVRAPSVVPKGNTRNGLLYFYENLKDPKVPDSDPWYWTAVDRRTGKVVWKRLAGYGGLYNNHYAGIALGRHPPGGKTTPYLGGIGGIMGPRDRRRAAGGAARPPSTGAESAASGRCATADAKPGGRTRSEQLVFVWWPLQLWPFRRRGLVRIAPVPQAQP